MESHLPTPDPAPSPNAIAKKKQYQWFFYIQVVLLILFFLVMLDTGSYGWTLFAIIPFSIGLTCGYYSKIFRSKSFLRGTFLVLMILAAISVLLIAAGMEGAICILMAEGILALPAFLGMVAGYCIRNAYQVYSLGLIILLNTSFLIYDAADATFIRSIASETIVINAPREKVWNILTHPFSFSMQENLFFKAGVTYPTSMELNYNGKGKCFLMCHLTNGSASLEIECLDSLERMRFLIPEEVQTMKELTFYDSLDAPHLKGYFDASFGEFTLKAIHTNQCMVTATTSYTYKITPAFYWRWWSDYLVNTMHRHILEDIKTRAEGH
jgi:hypothetical protein